MDTGSERLRLSVSGEPAVRLRQIRRGGQRRRLVSKGSSRSRSSRVSGTVATLPRGAGRGEAERAHAERAGAGVFCAHQVKEDAAGGGQIGVRRRGIGGIVALDAGGPRKGIVGERTRQ